MKLDDILNAAKHAAPKVMAVAAPEDSDALGAVVAAVQEGLVRPVLFGDEAAIRRTAGQVGLELSGCEIRHTQGHADAAAQSVALVRGGQAALLMKGSLHSSLLMKAVLNKETGIRKESVLCVVSIIESERFDRLLFLSDGAMVAAPDLSQKISIINSAVAIARRLGVATPKVACLAAVETVSERMPATTDAAILALMSQRGQFSNCLVDGPLAFDNAVSPDSARHKNVKSPVGVAGYADILLVPNIESGNILLKASRLLGDCRTVGLLAGASVPIVMNSRADSAENKLRAIACAAYEPA